MSDRKRDPRDSTSNTPSSRSALSPIRPSSMVNEPTRRRRSQDDSELSQRLENVHLGAGPQSSTTTIPQRQGYLAPPSPSEGAFPSDSEEPRAPPTIITVK